MNVNFNNLRKQAMFAVDRLTDKLNNSIMQSKKEYNDNMIRIDPDEIQEEMDDISMLVGFIASVNVEGDDEFKDVYSEAYPDDSSMKPFNPEDEGATDRN